MSNSANIQINLMGNVFAQVDKLQANFAEVINVVEKVDSTVNQSVNNINKKLSAVSVNAVVDQFRNLTDAVSNVSAPGIGFEKGVADLSAITGIAGKELEGLEEQARKVGVSSGLGASGAVEAYKLLASQIQVDKIGISGLNALHKETITLAQASGMSMADAANSMAGTINQFGLEADQANRVINVLAAGSKYGAAEIPDLAQSFKVVGAAANAAGLNIEQTAGAIEVLSKNNLKGAEAGTALRNIVLKMQTALGIDFKKVGFSDALDALKPKLNDATYLSKLFGMENVAASQFLITNAGAVKEMTDQVNGTNVAQEQAAITTQTTAFKMQQWRASIDDAKISMFDLMGSSAGFLTVAGEQMVMFAQLLPLIKGVGSAVMWLTKAENLQKIATMGLSVAKGIWTGVQWALNAALWACPLTWIIVAIMALVGAIIYLCTQVEGWAAQWDSVVNFAKNCWDLFTESIKFGWNTMIDGLMIGLDYIKIGWYKFKEAVGLGDSTENQDALAEISSSIEARKSAMVEGAKKIAELSAKTANSLSWELSMKKDDATAVENTLPAVSAPGNLVQEIEQKTTVTPKFSIDFDSKSDSGSGKGEALNLDKVVPQDIKGVSAYSAIVAKLSSIKIPSLATAAASLAMPLAVASTSLPTSTTPKELPVPVMELPETPKYPTPEFAKELPVQMMELPEAPKYPAPNLNKELPTPVMEMPAIITEIQELPNAPKIEQYSSLKKDNQEYGRKVSNRTFNVKACDKIEIHINKADEKGFVEIEKRINAIASKAAAETLNKILDNYEA